MVTSIDLDELQRKHDEVMKSAKALEELRKANQERAKNHKLPHLRPVGIFGSLVIMACTAFCMIAFIVLIAAVFL